MTFVICPTCGAQSNVLPPHGDGPCPLALVEHQARLAVLEAKLRLVQARHRRVLPGGS